MKKISLVLITLAIVSCKNEKKEYGSDKQNEGAITAKFIAKPEATSVKWTAYKTTEKLPVGGEFKILKFDNKEGATPQEVLNNLNFSIPINSLFTNDATNTRDAKIIESFFGAMLKTEFLKGTIKFENNNYSASITMNGVTQVLPLEVSITEERKVTMTGTMLLKEWDALEALESLNKVCFDLHKGPDGISKTWDEVAISVSTYLSEN